MREELKKEILAMIARNDGKLSWYQIARALTDERFLPVIDQMGDIMDEIKKDGLVRVENNKFLLTSQEKIIWSQSK